MHMMICVLLNAEDKDDALESGKGILEDLCGENKFFDYWSTFDGPEPEDSDQSRWPYVKGAVQASSKDGKKLITEGMMATKEEFDRSIVTVRKALAEYDNEALFKDDHSSFRYACSKIGADESASFFLYDSCGSGIRSRHDLKSLMAESNGNLWVVPADVHF